MTGSTASVARRLAPVAILAAILATAAAIGLIGSPIRPERFDAKTIVYAPAPDGGLRVTEIVDIDFGTAQRRGYERVLRTDLGEPTDITAESSTMSNRLNLFTEPGEVTIRVGDPDVTESGRHRFVLGYTLPGAATKGEFDLSVIDAGEELETGRFTVVLDGFTLTDPLCSVGGTGAIGGCELGIRPDGRQGVVIEPLSAGDGLNLSGRATLTGPPTGVDVDPLPPEAPGPAVWWRALVIVAATLVTGWWVARRAVRRGMNEVGGDSVADAVLPGPDGPRRHLTDDALASMVSIEFTPPGDVAPWEGRVLLDEAAPDAIAGTWISTMLGSGALTVDDTPDGVIIAPGPAIGSCAERDRTSLAALIPGGAPRRVPDAYDAAFAATWTSIAADLRDRVDHRGWWARPIGSTSARGTGLAAYVVAVTGALTFALLGLGLRSGGVANPITGTAVGATVVAALMAGAVTLLATWAVRASRTAAGSAAYLRVASFRRFLATSEGRHVEEAHRRGVLREYTAWAVALGEADAWERAAATLGSAAVLTTVTSTTFMHHHATTFSSATTAPSSSGGVGGGGGGVGGGGGGGSSGSW